MHKLTGGWPCYGGVVDVLGRLISVSGAASTTFGQVILQTQQSQTNKQTNPAGGIYTGDCAWILRTSPPPMGRPKPVWTPSLPRAAPPLPQTIFCRRHMTPLIPPVNAASGRSGNRGKKSLLAYK
eukprot:sb/3475701/